MQKSHPVGVFESYRKINTWKRDELVVSNPILSLHLIELTEWTVSRWKASTSVCLSRHLGASSWPSFINCFLFKDNQAREIESRAIAISSLWGIASSISHGPFAKIFLYSSFNFSHRPSVHYNRNWVGFESL